MVFSLNVIQLLVWSYITVTSSRALSLHYYLVESESQHVAFSLLSEMKLIYAKNKVGKTNLEIQMFVIFSFPRLYVCYLELKYEFLKPIFNT